MQIDRIEFRKQKPVPSNVIAKETDESPLINVKTANGARRPILNQRSTFSIRSKTFFN